MSQSFAFPATLYLVPGALQALSDVSVNPGSAQDGSPLVWNDASSFWQAGTVPRVNGLRFPSSQVANADSNTLDDYKEAVFNPVLADTADFQSVDQSGYTYDFSTGLYTKIGNICNYSGFIGITQKPDRTSTRFVAVTIPFLGLATWQVNAQIKPNTLSAYDSTWSLGNCGPLKTSLYAALYKSVSFSSGTQLLTLDDIQVSPYPIRINFSFSYITN